MPDRYNLLLSLTGTKQTLIVGREKDKHNILNIVNYESFMRYRS